MDYQEIAKYLEEIKELLLKKEKIIIFDAGVELPAEIERKIIENDKFSIIKQDDKEAMLKLYKMYEFTNKLVVLSSEEQYPSIFNYYRQGLLSVDELIEAL